MRRSLLLALVCCVTAGHCTHVLLEAEAFDQLGGWVVDQQFMDQMGSPYLLAHGLGEPVKDATTKAAFLTAGTWHVWARTRDWVAPWQAPGAPGRFQVLVDGRPLATTFGTEGAAWHWQDGGTVTVGPQPLVALHDLTGFEGRCDALLFSSEPGFTPTNEPAALAAFRRQTLGLSETPGDGGSYDLVVVGGGIAGVCAALSAARLGLTVALVQDRPVLGGNNSSEVRVWLNGNVHQRPYTRMGDIVSELEPRKRAHAGPANTADIYEDARREQLVRDEPKVKLLLELRANAVEMRAGQVAAVIAQSTRTAQRLRLACRWVADCTGDGAVGALAGADFDVSLTGHMGPSNLWNACECKDTSALGSATAATPQPAPFPRCPWAVDLRDKPFPGRPKAGGKLGPNPSDQLGQWFWESGFDKDPINEVEWMRDLNLRAMYGAWDALKNVDGLYPNHKLAWAAFVAGKRESRRLLGDVQLKADDFRQGVAWPDACFPCTWGIDLHYASKGYAKGHEGSEFISYCTGGAAYSYKGPYWAPYRCLYSRNVPNLFMAGRDISVTHEALGPVRVMRTCGVMGEVVGMAASLCKAHDTNPRGVYERHLAELKELLVKGVGKPGAHKATVAVTPPPPAWLAKAGPNLAPAAKVAVSGSRPGAKTEWLHDGQADLSDNDARWLSDGKLPAWIELTFEQPTAIGAARIVSGYATNGEVSAPLEAFALQWLDGETWRDVPGAVVKGNEQAAWDATFAPVTATKVRVRIDAVKGGIARVWEVEAYGPLAPK